VVGEVGRGTVGHHALTGVVLVPNWILGTVAEMLLGDHHVAAVEGMIMVAVAGTLATNTQIRISNFSVGCLGLYHEGF